MDIITDIAEIKLMIWPEESCAVIGLDISIYIKKERKMVGAHSSRSNTQVSMMKNRENAIDCLELFFSFYTVRRWR